MEKVSFNRAYLFMALFVSMASCSRVSSTYEDRVLGPDPMITVHELDVIAEEEVGYTVHTEENCDNCYQGDMIIPEGAALPPSSFPSSFMEAKEKEGYNMTLEWLIRGGRAWPDGIVYFTFKPSTSEKVKEVTLAAMKVWEEKTCIFFRDVATNPTFKHPVVIGDDRVGCNAVPGYYNHPDQRMNLGKGCEHVGTALHELGHVLGLMHEQERENRDEYVRINTANIQPEMMHNYNKAAWRDEATKTLPYDLSSIMHYDSWAFAVNKNFKDFKTQSIDVLKKDSYGNCQVGQRVRLSIGDLLTVSILYGCPHPPVNATASAFSDPTCQDDPEGWSGLTCLEVAKLKSQQGLLGIRKGPSYCFYSSVQRACSRTCGNCEEVPFCW